MKFSSTSGGRDTVLIDSSSLSHNIADPSGGGGRGGGLHLAGGNGPDIQDAVIITSTELDANVSATGGGIYHESNSRLDLSILNGSSVSGNIGNGFPGGGGIYSNSSVGSRITIENSSISENSSATHGGGVFNETARFLVRSLRSDGLRKPNTWGGLGGGVYAYAIADPTNPLPLFKSISMVRTLISGNTAVQSRRWTLYTQLRRHSNR